MKISRRSFLSTVAVPSLISLAYVDSLFAQEQLSDLNAAALITDSIGKQIKPRGIALVDWDGYIANPAVQISLAPATGIAFPASVTLWIDEPRIFFDSPSSYGMNGARKSIVFTDANTSVPVRMSVLPDRSGFDSDHVLNIELIDNYGNRRISRIPVHIFDQDELAASAFGVTSDYSYDKADLFADPIKRKAVQQAADDWAYFIDDMDPGSSGSWKRANLDLSTVGLFKPNIVLKHD